MRQPLGKRVALLEAGYGSPAMTCDFSVLEVDELRFIAALPCRENEIDLSALTPGQVGELERITIKLGPGSPEVKHDK